MVDYKDYAKLGDSIVNFVVSAVCYLRTGQLKSIRVTNRILKEIYLKYKDTLPPKPKGVDRATFIEALFAKIWIEGVLSIEDMIKIGYKGSGDEFNVKQVLSKILEESVGARGYPSSSKASALSGSDRGLPVVNIPVFSKIFSLVAKRKR
ncbi:MAG: hypothetical protein DRJ32_07855 [Thermoprotei archaeon]|nr:MAG: hypothetical protein DRJ32_07855 [Thermoprotei archaeon]